MKPKSHRPSAGQNFKDGTLFIADNLHILRCMNSETVDLIYLDPPFNSKKQYKAPIGTAAEGQSFDDTWRWDELDVRWLGEIDRRNPALAAIVEAARLTQGDGTAAYLAFMGVRLLELHRVLKPSGAIYLHCDPTANAYLRVAMDAVFGKANFRNEIVWAYPPKGASPKLGFHRKHDTIIYYGKTGNGVFNHQYTPLDARQQAKFSKTDRDGRKYKDFKGQRTYLDQSKGRPVPSWWTDIAATGQSRNESTGWTTQKPLALLQRIVKASSNIGDLVLDPFAGCATCLVAAAIEGRRWVGIEACEAANDILQVRLEEADLGKLGASASPALITRKPPKRTDLNADEPKHQSKAYRTRNNIDFLYGNQRGFCAGCRRHYHSKDFAIDHIVPRAAGGSNELDNLQLLCTHCNSTKGKGTMADLHRRLAEQEAEMRQRMMAA